MRESSDTAHRRLIALDHDLEGYGAHLAAVVNKARRLHVGTLGSQASVKTQMEKRATLDAESSSLLIALQHGIAIALKRFCISTWQHSLITEVAQCVCTLHAGNMMHMQWISRRKRSRHNAYDGLICDHCSGRACCKPRTRCVPASPG